MINIVICDDDINFLDLIENKVIKIFEDKRETIRLHKFINGMELIKSYDNQDKCKRQVLFLKFRKIIFPNNFQFFQFLIL